MSVTQTWTEGPLESQSEEENVPAIVQTQHPLLNHVVLEAVFNYIHVATLKTCRLVCQKWKILCTPKLLSKSRLCLHADDASGLISIKKWMDSSPIKWFQNFSCERITHHSYKNIWPLLGVYIKSLNIAHWWGDTNDLTLADYEDILLNKCPNLEEITVASTATFKNGKRFLLYTTRAKSTTRLKLRAINVVGNTKPDWRFWRLLSICPHLTTLRIDCGVSEEFWNAKSNKKVKPVWDFSLLKNLAVRGYANESVSEQSRGYFTSQPWTLEKLTMECYHNLTDCGLNSGFAHISSTLKEIFLILYNRECNQWPVGKKQVTLVPGHLMKKIEKFKLEIDDKCSGPLHCQVLVSSLLFPALKSLTLAMNEDCEMNGEDWPNGLFVEMSNALTTSTESDNSSSSSADLKCDTLESLALPPKFQDISCIVLLPTTFPNLKELKLDTPTPNVVSQVFMCCPTLERFALLLSSTSGPHRPYDVLRIIDWNFILTGAQLSQNPAELACQFIGSSIKNLQGLKYLEIVMKAGDPIPLVDFTIYNGLLYLCKSIQHLNISGHMFSQMALNILQQYYHPYCHFEL